MKLTVILIALVVAIAAQAVDPISGGAGWVGAGLLGCVLGVIFFVIFPAQHKRDREKDDMIMNLVNAKDKAVSEVVTAFRAEAVEQRTASATQAAEQRTANTLALKELCNEFRTDSQLDRASHEKSIAILAQSVDSLAGRGKPV